MKHDVRRPVKMKIVSSSILQHYKGEMYALYITLNGFLTLTPATRKMTYHDTRPLSRFTYLSSSGVTP